MPRRSAADLATFNVSGAPDRLVPPAELTGAARKIFVNIVSTLKPGHFVPSDQPMLVAYCRAVARAEEAAATLAIEGQVITTDKGRRRNPWCDIEAQAHKVMVQFARGLRLSPQARRPSDPTRPSKPEPVLSYYDRVRLEEASADEDDEAISN
jgi:P27 family predicted phage terminase small subunit